MALRGAREFKQLQIFGRPRSTSVFTSNIDDECGITLPCSGNGAYYRRSLKLESSAVLPPGPSPFSLQVTPP
jgi:hypothetical protein